jgi:DNA-binding GntR family transcriptional regulator
VWEQAYETLRAQILEGRLAPGARLNLRDVAAHLGVSVTPARDAALRLASEGLVETTGGRSLRVTQLTERDVVQTLALRTLLETYAVEQGGACLTEDAFRRLEELLALEGQVVADPAGPDWRRYADLSQQFHHTLVAAADNRLLLDLYERLHAYVVMERAQRGYYNERAVADHDEHVAIIAALRRGAVAVAVALLRDHLEQVRSHTLHAYRAHS